MTPDALPASTALQAASTAGKQVRRLTLFDGYLIPSYGDYGTNDGPHDLIGLPLADPTDWESFGTLQTEQLYTLREAAGVLIVPFVDPRGGTDSPSNGQVARLTTTGTLTVLTNVTPVPVHVWDTAVTADGWWLFGSSEVDGSTGTATIWRSTDDGATWTASLNVPSGTPTWDEGRDAGARFYGVQQYSDGTLIANLLGAADPEARLYRRDPGSGSSWVEVTDADTPLIASSAQVGFTRDGVEFFVAVGNGTVSVRSEDAANLASLAALVPSGMVDVYATADHLWFLDLRQAVWRLAATGAAVSVVTLDDPTLRSLAVDETAGMIYLGTTDGRVVSTPVPA